MSVESEDSLVAALALFRSSNLENAAVLLAKDIYLSSSIIIRGMMNIKIHGNGFFIDGQGIVQCLVLNRSSVFISDLVIRNGAAVIQTSHLLSPELLALFMFLGERRRNPQPYGFFDLTQHKFYFEQCGLN